MSRQWRVVVALVVGCAAVGAFGTAPALAGLPLHAVYGETGTGSGQFQEIGGVALALSGDLLVADTGNDRIQRLAPDGTALDEFGASELTGPTGIAVGSDGSIYVADTGNNRIARFSAAGAFEAAFGGTILTAPRGVAVAPDGAIYVVDTGNHRVVKFTAAGTFDSEPITGGEEAGQVIQPVALAVTSTGAIFVLDQTRLQKFGSDGAFDSAIATDGDPSPDGLALDRETDHLYFVAFPGDFSTDRRIVEIDQSGASVETHGLGAIAGGFIGGIVVSPGGASIYVAAKGLDAVEAFSEPAASEPVLALQSIDPTAEEAEVIASIDPEGIPTGVYFEYSADDGSSWVPYPANTHGEPDPVAIGASSDPVDFSRVIGGLEPNSEYQVRVNAKSLAGEVVTAPTTFQTDAPPPAVAPLWAGSLTTTEATLAARVNPRNSSASYFFEYGVGSAFDRKVPGSAISLDADNELQTVSQGIAGLEPETTYMFRVVAESSPGTTTGPTRAFTTPATTVDPPAARAYEKVSPGDKNGFSVIARSRQAAAVDGARVSFNLLGVGPGAEQGGSFSTYLASRDPDQGWVSEPPIDPLTPPTFGVSPGVTGFSEDLSQSVMKVFSALTPGAMEGHTQLVLRDNDTGQYRLLTPEPAPPANGGPTTSSFTGAVATPDFGHFAFDAEDIPQTADVVGGHFNTYTWTDGVVRLAGLNPPESEISCGSGGPTCVSSPFGSMLGSGRQGTTVTALSEDAQRIVFHALLPGVGDDPTLARSSTAGRLYVREGDTTVQLNASHRDDPDPAGPLPARFWGAEAPHGGSAIFTSCEKLTDDSTATTSQSPECGNSGLTGSFALGSDLYRFDLESRELRDLTTTDPRGADVFGVAGFSMDLESIYFVAGGVLAPGAIRNQPNLYLWRHGATRLVATLDSKLCAGPSNRQITDCLIWNVKEDWGDRVLRVSPDGRFLLFASRARVSGYDNSGPGCFGGSCAQVYLYDSVAEELSCVSCPPAVPSGDAELVSPNAVEANFGEPSRNLAADGSYVFFNTSDPLLPSDSNGKTDVYRWAEGHATPISNRAGASDAYFVDAGADGSDAFFLTRDRLLATDQDELVDLYDARVGGGFPEPSLPPVCDGEGCLPPAAVPTDPTPASSGIAASGNARSVRPRCRRGKLLRKGRCIPRKRAKRRGTSRDRRRTDSDRRTPR